MALALMLPGIAAMGGIWTYVLRVRRGESERTRQILQSRPWSIDRERIHENVR